jgi:hypothetical protein
MKVEIYQPTAMLVLADGWMNGWVRGLVGGSKT